MRKRWTALTLFLHKSGVPLTNNLVERFLKRAIVHRNNSLFFRSLEGARIGARSPHPVAGAASGSPEQVWSRLAVTARLSPAAR
jgi:hypothetical protein